MRDFRHVILLLFLKRWRMELHRIESDGITKYVLLDDNMRLIQPVNRYLEYQRLRGRSAKKVSELDEAQMETLERILGEPEIEII